MKVFKTAFKGYNEKGAKIVSLYITEDKKYQIRHLKSNNGWDLGWTINDTNGKCITAFTSTNIHNICKRFNWEEAF